MDGECKGNVSVFRVDRLYHPEILDAKAIRRPEGFSLDRYSKQIFTMFGGEEVTVRLECRGELMKYIIDRFGEDVKTERVGDGAGTQRADDPHSTDGDRFVATVDVALSSTFYSWGFQFGGDMKILSPERAVEEMRTMARAQV